MLLYIQDYEYLKGLTLGKGVRLALHPFNTSAFVVENGISLAPGTEAFIGTKLVSYGLDIQHEITLSEN